MEFLPDAGGRSADGPSLVARPAAGHRLGHPTAAGSGLVPT